jgi:hypothetical protein
MKIKRPFHLSFPDQTVIVETRQLPHRNGIPIFTAANQLKYLEENHPEKVNEFVKHLENFEKKFAQIDKLLNK